MIRLMIHQGHSASDSLVADGRRAWLASEALAGGCLSAALSVSNHDEIRSVSHHWHSAPEALVSGCAHSE
jgi:hypothetical protein